MRKTLACKPITMLPSRHCPIGISNWKLHAARCASNSPRSISPDSAAMISPSGWKPPVRCSVTPSSRKGRPSATSAAVQVYSADRYVRMDAATRRNLEITQTLRGEPAPTLLSLLDTCATNMGSRLLHHWLHHPLRDRAVLNARLDAVDKLGELHRKVHEQLKPCVDVERITARIALRSARPRDLSGLRDTLRATAATASHCCTRRATPFTDSSRMSRRTETWNRTPLQPGRCAASR